MGTGDLKGMSHYPGLIAAKLLPDLALSISGEVTRLRKEKDTCSSFHTLSVAYRWVLVHEETVQKFRASIMKVF